MQSILFSNFLISIVVADVFAPDCHGLKDSLTCMNIPECTWCDSAAVPSACYTKAEGAQLPAAVFKCESKKSRGAGNGFKRSNAVEDWEVFEIDRFEV